MLISSVWRGSSLRWFNAGLLLGGTATALVVLVVASLVIRPWWPAAWTAPLLASAAVPLLLRELGLVRLPLPQNARLVPQEVVDSGPVLGALQFGFEMGTGLRTYVTSSLPYLALVSLALLAGPWHAVAAGVGFGAGRALMTTTRDWSRAPAAWDRHLAVHERAVRLASFALGGAALTWILLHN